MVIRGGMPRSPFWYPVMRGCRCCTVPVHGALQVHTAQWSTLSPCDTSGYMNRVRPCTAAGSASWACPLQASKKS